MIFSDERNHASLIDGARLSRRPQRCFRTTTWSGLRRLLAQRRGRRPRPSGFVVVESLFSMDGDMAPLAEYAEVCRAAGAALIVDEAHAVGIYGERGSGLIEAQASVPTVTASINTAGKALGVAGAFVAGSASAIAYLTQRARPFVFSTAPPPALADALDASLDLVEAEPERRRALRERSPSLRARGSRRTEIDGAAGLVADRVGRDRRQRPGRRAWPRCSRTRASTCGRSARRPCRRAPPAAHLGQRRPARGDARRASPAALAAALREAGVPCAVSS